MKVAHQHVLMLSLRTSLLFGLFWASLLRQQLNVCFAAGKRDKVAHPSIPTYTVHLPTLLGLYEYTFSSAGRKRRAVREEAGILRKKETREDSFFPLSSSLSTYTQLAAMPSSIHAITYPLLTILPQCPFPSPLPGFFFPRRKEEEKEGELRRSILPRAALSLIRKKRR